MRIRKSAWYIPSRANEKRNEEVVGQGAGVGENGSDYISTWKLTGQKDCRPLKDDRNPKPKSQKAKRCKN